MEEIVLVIVDLPIVCIGEKEEGGQHYVEPYSEKGNGPDKDKHTMIWQHQHYI